MTELDKLSPVQREALERDCAASGVPLQVEDLATIEKIVALIRSVRQIDESQR